MKKKIATFFLMLFLQFYCTAANAYLPPPGSRESSFKIEQEETDPSYPVLLQFDQILFAVIFTLLIITYTAAFTRERKRFALLMSNSNDTILLIDRKGNILDCISGCIKVERLEDMFSGETKWELISTIEKCGIDHKGTLFHLTLQTDEAYQSRYYRIQLKNMYNRREIHGIVATLLDISEAKKLENDLKTSQELAFHEARHDMLTGAPNRLYFNEIVSRKFIRLERHPEETMCLLMIDLDHFKMINDTWGHDAGDKVLKKLTGLCSAEVRGSDMFARYGGEEFIVFLDDLPLAEGVQVAERMRLKVEQNRDWEKGIHLTISVGVAEYSRENLLDDLIKNADIALYRAKAMGRNRVCLYDSQ